LFVLRPRDTGADSRCPSGGDHRRTTGRDDVFLGRLPACQQTGRRGGRGDRLRHSGALGNVANLAQEMSLALAPADAEAKQAVEQAPVKNVDVTCWKQAGQKRWLWTAATTQVACYVILAGSNASLRQVEDEGWRIFSKVVRKPGRPIRGIANGQETKEDRGF
jgi:hypothetical protein